MPLGPLLMVNPRRTKRRRRNTPKRDRRGRFVKTPKRRRRTRRNPWVQVGRGGARVHRYGKPKVRTYRRVRRKPTKKRKTRKTVSRRRTNMPRKSRKRVLAGKKAWRTRRRRGRVTNPRRRRRRANPKRRRRRRRNAWVRAGRGGGEVWVDLRTKEGRAYRKRRKKTTKRRRRKPVARRKKRRVTRRRRKPVRRRRRRRTYGKRRRSQAMKRAWRKRRTGYRRVKGRKVYMRTRRGRRMKRPYKSRRTGRYSIWRNPDALKDIAMPLALASLGFVGSALIMTAKPVADTIAKQSPTVQKVAKIGVPIAAAVGIMMFAPKIKALAKYSKQMYFLAFGLALAGGVAGVQEVLKGTEIGDKLGLSGYTVRPMGGFVRRPGMAGFVRARSLGQMEERVPRTLGKAMTPYGGPIEYRGRRVPAHLPGQKMNRALGYQPEASKPYGLGLPSETRRYNEFGWTGVYNRGSYENS